MPSRRRHREVTRGATGSGDDPSPRAANGEPARAGSTAPRPVAPAGVRRIATVEEASALAALLLSAERCHPVVDKVEGVDRRKVVSVVVEVVTGLVEQLAGRDLHPLRTGPGGDDPPALRKDGAVCMRAALQRNTPS